MQAAIRQFGFDGWLLYDFRASNVLARRVLRLSDNVHTSRRSSTGSRPTREAPGRSSTGSRIRSSTSCPATRRSTSAGELHRAIDACSEGAKRVAMEYSHLASSFLAVSRVDAGAVELRPASLGPKIVSSGDRPRASSSSFEAVWDAEQEADHSRRGQAVDTDSASTRRGASSQTGCGTSASMTERQVQQVDNSWTTSATGYTMTTYPRRSWRRTLTPGCHYETGAVRRYREGDLVLIDLWAKLDQPRSIYSDLTRMAYAGAEFRAVCRSCSRS